MSNFINSHLIKDEKVIYEAKPHWLMLIGPALFVTLLVVVMIAFESIGRGDQGSNGKEFTVGLISWAILMIPTLFFTWLKYKSLEIAITDKRIIAKRGIVSKYTFEQYLNKIESVQVHQSLFGRMFNAGNVIITGTGGTKEIFGLIENPFMFRSKFAEMAANL